MPSNASPLRVSSASFANGQPIPQRLSCDGANLSPDLTWSGAPSGTRSYAIVMDDTDTPSDFTHWLVYDLPADTHHLQEGAASASKRLEGASEGLNNFGRAGYGGPCPPGGSAHHYVFRVYALDTDPALPAEEDRQQLEAAIGKHVLAQGILTGTYQRGG
ncbi:YbhB/YbcL family Raf kinase inhibitor-like protein [Dyella mobilis]|uniref:YbhB/YbcL family Raf kinase inhibitor-like protein n=2 Tax=Dyella mobilis TaxID=1849582 RepID=A0ABS2KIT5_9GAMM|nr:YbhB/YbcL family Raf kinase inhibitor-like protein [Dyella mobilis]